MATAVVMSQWFMVGDKSRLKIDIQSWPKQENPKMLRPVLNVQMNAASKSLQNINRAKTNLRAWLSQINKGSSFGFSIFEQQ